MHKMVVLYADESAESKQAGEILRKHKIGYELIPSVGPGVPSAQVDTDLYTGLAAITSLAQEPPGTPFLGPKQAK